MYPFLKRWYNLPKGMQPQDLRSALACLLILVLYSRGMGAQPAAHATAPRLVMLAETGRERDGVPVLRPDSGAGEISTWLSRGFTGRWLRLYQYEQEYLRRATGSRPEPAYLLLSGWRGGFPRFVFYLEDQ